MINISSLDLFLDGLEEGVMFLDKGRQVIAINEAAAQLVGQSREAVVHQLCPAIFAGTSCAHSCASRGNCALTPDLGDTRKIQDIVLKRPDGSEVFLRMWALLLPSAGSGVHCAIILRNRSREVELEMEVKERLKLGGMTGHSPAMQELYEKLLRIAMSDATALITGESGVGKELVARALHDNSERCKGPYVPVHCAALPEHLLESELFGHAKGAFTGATAAREGRFEAANGGTLLLDEIGEIPPGIQVKLLRVLQEREVVRLGENHGRKVDVRVVAATHRDLGAMVERGEFRQDLYYRLRVLPLHVPALRQRKEDIALLSNRLLDTLRKRYKREQVRLAPETLAVLEVYDWPGNIRQLSNALEYALVHADGTAILPYHLPPEIKSASREHTPAIDETGETPLFRQYYRAPPGVDREKAAILRALEDAGGNKAEAARKLGMSRTTLWKRLKEIEAGGEQIQQQ